MQNDTSILPPILTCLAALTAMQPQSETVLLERALRWCSVPPAGDALLWSGDLVRVQTVVAQWEQDQEATHGG